VLVLRPHQKGSKRQRGRIIDENCIALRDLQRDGQVKKKKKGVMGAVGELKMVVTLWSKSKKGHHGGVGLA
jgi:hypothetical protein